MPRKGILERLREGVVLGDGGYILESADLDRHPGIQKSRTLDEMAGRKPKSPEAPRFATGDRNW